MKDKIFRTILTLAIVCSVIISSFMPQIVYADTQNRAINGARENGTGAGTRGFNSYVGGAGDYTVLNSDDNDTSYARYLFTSVSYGYSFWPFESFVTGHTSIESVTLYIKAKRIGGYSPSTKCAVKISATEYLAPMTYITWITSYSTESYTWNTNPATGTAWTADEVNNAKFGFYAQRYPNQDSEMYVTYMYLMITYTAPSVPTASTSAASSISYNGTHYVTLNGAISSTGGENADYRGFCYGTTSNSTTPSSGEVPPASYTSNITQTGTYGTGTFSQLVTGLAQGTTYYYRAYAHNSQGWAYGSELYFTTLDDPAVTTVAASSVAATTARLNASISDDGGQACTIEFAYADTTLGPFTTYADISSNGTTIAATGTWTTGQLPYANVSGLTALTGYTFMASITNDVSTQYGSQLTFTTTSGISVPTEFNGIPTATTISLQWVKGEGSTNTRVQYKTGSYPTGVTDGTTAYFDDMNSVIVESLTPGTTYFFKAWGESGGTYSTANVTLMMTTLASVSAATPLPTPATPAEWYQTPDYTQMSELPFYGLVNWWADTWSIPRATIWSMLGLFGAMCAGIFVFFLSKGKTLLADIVVIVCLMFTTFMGLTQMWFVLPFAIIAIAAIILQEKL